MNLEKSQTNFSKHFIYLFQIFLAGATILFYFCYSNAESNFNENIKKRTSINSVKIANQIDNIFIYSENITSILAKNLARENTKDYQKVADILQSVKPQIDYEKYNIFTITLFNFISPEGKIIATSNDGVLKEPVKISVERRSWITDSRLRPWRFQIAKNDVGLISKELVIPIGFGITDSNGKFLGIISIGVNARKVKTLIESSLNNITTSFAILNNDNSTIVTSDNFDDELLPEIQNKISKEFTETQEVENALIKVGDQEFLYSKIKHYPKMGLIVGVNKSAVRSEFWPRISETFLQILYFLFFTLILLLFFKKKLLNPVIMLSKAANKISRGNINVYIPDSNITEIDSLSHSIRMMQKFIKKQSEDRLSLEKENKSRKEFLSSITHEFKNVTTGIIGAAEVIKSDLDAKIKAENKNISVEEMNEHREFLEDITNLSEEILLLAHDTIDINHLLHNDFKLEKSETVDLEKIVVRTAKLLRVHAVRNKKIIVTNFIKGEDSGFVVNNLDARLVKQIMVNIINNSIKHANDNSKIEITLEAIDKEVSEVLRDSILNNLRNNHAIETDHKNKLIRIISKARPQVIITVKDTSIGMTIGEIAEVLETSNLNMLNNNSDIKSLSLAKHLIEIQGGSFQISSQDGIGIEIKIIF